MFIVITYSTEYLYVYTLLIPFNFAAAVDVYDGCGHGRLNYIVFDD